MSNMFAPVHLLKQLCGCTTGQPPDANERAQDEAPVLDTTTLPARYRAYGILYGAGIPLCIWFEDALANFGVPTFTFALFLVVPTALLAPASKELEKAGYSKTRLPLAYRGIHQFENMYEPEKTSEAVTDESATTAEDEEDVIDSSNPPVVLLSADEWFYQLPETTAAMQDCFPTLPRYLTSIMSKWLGAAEHEDMLLMHLAIQLEYVYDYLDEVKQPGFEKSLPTHLWEFHLDGVSPTDRALSDFETQRRYRQKICEVHGGMFNANGEWVSGAERSSQ